MLFLNNPNMFTVVTGTIFPWALPIGQAYNYVDSIFRHFYYLVTLFQCCLKST